MILTQESGQDQSNVKVYDQKRTADYADYRIGLFYMDPFDLFVEGEPVITKLDSKRKRESDVIDLFGGGTDCYCRESGPGVFTDSRFDDLP